MTQEEIEGNTMIAEFMEWRMANDGYNDTMFNGTDKYCMIDNLKYHSSWDWLMPVVEKIEKIKGVHIFIKGNRCEILNYGFEMDSPSSVYKIESVWLAVVEFIKWYNQNKPA